MYLSKRLSICRCTNVHRYTCLHVCISLWLYVCMFMRLYVNRSLRLYVSAYGNTYIYTYTYICVCLHAYVYIYMRVWTYACTYVDIYMSIWHCRIQILRVRICISSHTFTPNEAEQTPIHPSVHPCMHACVFTGFCAYTYECWSLTFSICHYTKHNNSTNPELKTTESTQTHRL